MTARRVTLLVGPVEGRNTLVRGNVRDLLIEERVPARWSPLRRGWWVRNERIADVVALCEYRDIVVKAASS